MAELADLAAATLVGRRWRSRWRRAARRTRRRPGSRSSPWASAAAASSTTSATSTSSSSPSRSTDATAATTPRCDGHRRPRLMQICGHGRLAGRRRAAPRGQPGPLVRTLASHLAYYRRWARTWEFQALLKARPAAGDLALGQRVARRAARPLVWHAAERPEAVDDVPRDAPADHRQRAARRARPRDQARPGRAARHRVRGAAAAARARPGRRDAARRRPRCRRCAR